MQRIQLQINMMDRAKVTLKEGLKAVSEQRKPTINIKEQIRHFIKHLKNLGKKK